MLRFKSAALLGSAVLLLAACSSASPSATASPSAAAPTAVPQSSAAAPTPSAGVVAELEALIPDKIAGITMTKQSMKGSDLIASGSGDPAAAKFLQDLGVSPGSIAIAYGFGVSADASTGAAMFVFQATGAGKDKLVQVFKQSMDASRTTPLTWASQSVGGKDVQVATDSGQTTYLYATNDLLFMLSVNDPAAAAAVIASLP
jgi:hypothetical protein